MDVGIRYVVCNNLPAESLGPENGWRLSLAPMHGPRLACQRGVGGRGG